MHDQSPATPMVRFRPAIDPPTSTAANADRTLWFICRPGEIVATDDQSHSLPKCADLEALGIGTIRRQFLGYYDDRPCWSVEPDPSVPLPAGFAFTNLRNLYGIFEDDLFALAGRAIQIVDWGTTHRFCGRCATPTESVPGERAVRCPSCGLMNYPRLSPAVIVLVERDGRALLAQGIHFTNGMHSCLAGFVEPGETLEHAVARELYEEVGIRVRDIRYFGSQPWPFPHSLMIGFTAQYADGELTLDPNEIAAAGWFAPDALPMLPGKLSIARQLIDDFLARHGA